MFNEDKAETVSTCVADLGMQRLANWIPAKFHGEIREFLFDLIYTGIIAFVESPTAGRPIPDPSLN